MDVDCLALQRGFDAARLFSRVQRRTYSQGFATEGTERPGIQLFRDPVSPHSQGIIWECSQSIRIDKSNGPEDVKS